MDEDIIKMANQALNDTPFLLLFRRIEKDLNDVSGICAAATRKRIELEAEVKRLKHELDLEMAHSQQAEDEIKRLRDGIEKHRELNLWNTDHSFYFSSITEMLNRKFKFDEELYRLLEEK